MIILTLLGMRQQDLQIPHQMPMSLGDTPRTDQKHFILPRLAIFALIDIDDGFELSFPVGFGL